MDYAEDLSADYADYTDSFAYGTGGAATPRLRRMIGRQGGRRRSPTQNEECICVICEICG